MKFNITVRNTVTGNVWSEPYEKNTDDCVQWGKDIVDVFNSGLRPGENPREFVSAEIVEDSYGGADHDFEKTNLGTQTDKLGPYDTHRCKVCGITGKTRQLGDQVRLDKQFGAKIYMHCAASVLHLGRIQKRKGEKLNSSRQ